MGGVFICFEQSCRCSLVVNNLDNLHNMNLSSIFIYPWVPLDVSLALSERVCHRWVTTLFFIKDREVLRGPGKPPVFTEGQ